MKEAGTDIADLRCGKRSRCRGSRALHQKPCHHLRGPERNNGRGGGRQNSRRSRNVFDELFKEVIGYRAIIAILRFRQGNFSAEQMVGPEARIHGQQLLKTPHHQRGEKQDHHGNCDLSSYQRAAAFSSAASAATLSRA
jgi:hypothetical protein